VTETASSQPPPMREKLNSFFENNPKSSLRFDDDMKRHFIAKPWNDDTFEVGVGEDDDNLIDVLNRVHLPERYSAIYHPEAKCLEVAYTIFMPSGGKDIRTRQFDFHHNSITHKCAFRKSSNELLSIAKHVRQRQSFGPTNHRNLMSYNTYMLIIDGDIDPPAEIAASYKDALPISFWVENIDWDEDAVVDLIYHLNFYMSYFDNQSPVVIVHTLNDESVKTGKVARYPFGDFPPVITSNSIDRNLLHFWKASQEGDAARQFLYNFQILEYASYYMIEEEIGRQITRLLLAPNAISQASVIAAQIHEAFGASKMQESQKLEMLLRKYVKADIVSSVIEMNKEVFCNETIFEGGYKAASLATPKNGDFEKNWVGSISPALRNLRNALSHGKEMRMSSVITPTGHNMRLLQPWVTLISVITKEILVYRAMN